MKHVHQYETVSHHVVRQELIEHGIQTAEMRKCTECHREMPFVRTKKGDWLPLFEDREQDTHDILMA